MPGSRRQEIALLVVSLALTAGLAELLVRGLGLADRRPSGYAPVPTRKGERPMNARGYRDRERVIPKPAGVHRVLSLGDSFAWGFGVEYDDAYPQRVERGLLRHRHEPWEVVNLALRGMNSVQEAAQLTGEGFAYEPDVVVLGYVLNDSEDSEAAESRRVDDWVETAHRPPQFWQRSALGRLVGDRIYATRENRRRVADYLSMYDDKAPGWVAGQQALRTMAARCRERGVPFVVVIFPLFANPLDDGYPFRSIHEKVAQVAGQAGAKVVDLLPAYRGLRWDLLVVNGAEDEHPNEIAHRIAAGVVLRALDDVLPPNKAAERPTEAGPGSAVAP
jgi:GDSL-like Lipase/Acylhydrolase family